jgi:glycosyltransferase involved in cell wall biosynthesis
VQLRHATKDLHIQVLPVFDEICIVRVFIGKSLELCMKPDISIVIPLYNKERYIRRTIDSVLHQTFQNFECIIVDSSNDRSKEIIRKYADPRIILVPCEKSTAAMARNRGVLLARSDLIAFLDADDEWQLDHLAALVSLRQKFPEAGLYSTPYIKIRPDGRPQIMLFVGIPKPPWEGYLSDYLRICSRGDEPVHSSSCAVPRPVFNAAGGFPEDLKYGDDQYLWGRIALSYPVAYSWNGLAIYHTEALDRICDKPHADDESPFSVYLKRELDAGSISAEKRSACLAYIQRKGYTRTFFSLLTSGGASHVEESSDNGGYSPQPGIRAGLNERIGRLMSAVYNSRIHDAVRWFLCGIYGCYNPGKNFDLEKRR